MQSDNEALRYVLFRDAISARQAKKQVHFAEPIEPISPPQSIDMPMDIKNEPDENNNNISTSNSSNTETDQVIVNAAKKRGRKPKRAFTETDEQMQQVNTEETPPATPNKRPCRKPNSERPVEAKVESDSMQRMSLRIVNKKCAEKQNQTASSLRICTVKLQTMSVEQVEHYAQKTLLIYSSMRNKEAEAPK